MNEQDAIKRIEAIEKEAKELRKLVKGEGYPDGTPGYFWDGEPNRELFGWMTNRDDADYPYRLHRSPTLHDRDTGIFRNFEPLVTAILPNPVENTGEYQGDEDDLVMVEFGDGTFSAAHAREYLFEHGLDRVAIKRYWLIKEVS